MKDFFRQNGGWLLVIALLISILLGITSIAMGGSVNPLSDLVATVTAPIRDGIAAAVHWMDGVSNYVLHYGEMEEKIKDLEQEIAELKEELRGTEEALQENQSLRELLKLQAKRRDFVFENARVTARSTSNWQSRLTLDKGSEQGIALGDCVITETGFLIGVVTELGTRHAIVSTIIDAGLELGGMIHRTYSAGVLEGDFALMQEGRLKLSYLPDQAQLVVGDEVLTSGKGNVYPAGLVVGHVEGVFTDASGINRYAVIIPAAKLDELFEVFVVKDFEIVE